MIADIENAFAGVNYPGDARIVYNNSGLHLECNQVKDAFKGKSWKDLDLVFLVNHYSAVFFFTPEAFHFYLPAFLINAIKSYDQADMIPGTVIFTLTLRPYDESSRIRFFSKVQLFSLEQKRVIKKFLEYMRDEHGEDFPCGDLTEALMSYWINNVS